MKNPNKFSNASLHWDAANRPHSLLYGDIYYSRADALGESTHVFLQGNRLVERWRNLQANDFTVGELGFGAGINFLNTCRLWQSTAPHDTRLHYLACELHPFTHADLQRLYADMHELQLFSDIFLRSYPDHTAGVHQIEFTFGQHSVSLTLLLGDALQMLEAIYQPDGFRVDCWFLDGFSPKLNPAMWQVSLLESIARLSKPGTTLTTYSVAGALRQNLAEAGFSVSKVPGYAQKRHMLFACKDMADATAGEMERSCFDTSVTAPAKEKIVCVIGAGLAGCSTAFALARTGWKVVVLEREETFAMRGSGNAQGILHYRPARAENAERRFNLQAYLYAVRHYGRLRDHSGFNWHQCGMLQLAVNERLLARYQALVESESYAEQVLRLVDAAEATEIAGHRIELPGLFLPQSGWMSPRELCELYLTHPDINLLTGAEGTTLEEANEGWLIRYRQQGNNATIEAGNVVICNAADSASYAQTRHFPIVCNLGQVDYYAGGHQSLTRTVLCGQGYILPSNGEHSSVGGSFFVGGNLKANERMRQAEHVRAVQAMDQYVGDVLAQSEPQASRVGMRCATPDRMPVVGPVTQAAASAELLPGLYLNIAHGSHGLTRTPLCAAYLASLLNRTPAPVSYEVAAVIRPDRF